MHLFEKQRVTVANGAINSFDGRGSFGGDGDVSGIFQRKGNRFFVQMTRQVNNTVDSFAFLDSKSLRYKKPSFISDI